MFNANLSPQQGTCSTRWGGFDNCPVAVADEIEHHCRTTQSVSVRFEMVESFMYYGICDLVQSLCLCVYFRGYKRWKIMATVLFVFQESDHHPPIHVVHISMDLFYHFVLHMRHTL